ncbi:hypothetical protein [Streptomyces capoamus]|uniref:hypothetical protein n=1 Tax=Streptomyces capoamus TaxID=68183 RepID=UPI001676BF3F|nr:hypothetical protein [Streptomyces capoamus]
MPALDRSHADSELPQPVLAHAALPSAHACPAPTAAPDELVLAARLAVTELEEGVAVLATASAVCHRPPSIAQETSGRELQRFFG